MPAVDTLLQEQALLQRKNLPIKPGDLGLQACRDHYNLPPYPAHNALLDALATAELLLAMVKHRSGGRDFPLRQLL
jgi:DNA polymerase-3 subunit epsilon